MSIYGWRFSRGNGDGTAPFGLITKIPPSGYTNVSPYDFDRLDNMRGLFLKLYSFHYPDFETITDLRIWRVRLDSSLGDDALGCTQWIAPVLPAFQSWVLQIADAKLRVQYPESARRAAAALMDGVAIFSQAADLANSKMDKEYQELAVEYTSSASDLSSIASGLTITGSALAALSPLSDPQSVEAARQAIAATAPYAQKAIRGFGGRLSPFLDHDALITTSEKTTSAARFMVGSLGDEKHSLSHTVRQDIDGLELADQNRWLQCATLAVHSEKGVYDALNWIIGVFSGPYLSGRPEITDLEERLMALAPPEYSEG